MKILIPVFVFLAFGIHAQVVDDVNLTDLNVTYIQVVGMSKMLSSKVTVHVDYGQKTKFVGGKGANIKDDEGKNRTFESMIEAINWFADHGWEYVDAYVLTTGSQQVYHYILRRKE